VKMKYKRRGKGKRSPFFCEVSFVKELERMIRNLKMMIEYDGTRYCGWQRQVGHMTIQQLLEESIGSVTQENIKVIGSGRTDSGVHAISQVANFKTSSTLAERSILAGINSILPGDIVVKDLVEVHESFHATHDAKSKIYLYRILNGTVRSALQRQYAWFIRSPLDVDLMKKGALLFLGRHDFSSFCGTGCDVLSHIRTIQEIAITQDDHGMIRIIVEADGFLRYMVRNIVGMLFEVGKEKRSVDEISAVIEAKDRRQAGMTAPAHGLFLKEVKY
jgi:tRNA pseudouridine38-40 synthase